MNPLFTQGGTTEEELKPFIEAVGKGKPAVHLVTDDSGGPPGHRGNARGMLRAADGLSEGRGDDSRPASDDPYAPKND